MKSKRKSRLTTKKEESSKPFTQAVPVPEREPDNESLQVQSFTPAPDR